MKTEFLGLKPEEFEQILSGWKEPLYRSRQILEAVYRKKRLSFDEIQNIPKALRKKLTEFFDLGSLRLLEERQSEDHSIKFLLGLRDQEAVETVLIRSAPVGQAAVGRLVVRHRAIGSGRSDQAADGGSTESVRAIGSARRRTLCISIQVGCKFACRFCASGVAGFRRNLTPGEIVGQVLTVAQKVPREVVTHIVCMGMGEPLDNATNLLKALEILTDPRALGLGRRRITLSTVGLIPGIQKLIQAKRPWELSISLHAPNDRIRSEIMPVNRAYPVDRLLEAARQYTKLTKRYVTFEYILIAGVNDELETAQELARKLRGMPCKVNLIPYNPIPEYPEKRPSLKAIRAFERTLRSRGVRVTVRFSKGGDINAACGQLRLHG